MGKGKRVTAAAPRRAVGLGQGVGAIGPEQPRRDDVRVGQSQAGDRGDMRVGRHRWGPGGGGCGRKHVKLIWS